MIYSDIVSCLQEILNLTQKINNNQQTQRYMDNFTEIFHMNDRTFNELDVEEITKCTLLANELKSAISKYANNQMDENGSLHTSKSEFFQKV